jgi:RNA polymerase sigma factor (sigma-70 family)
MVEMQNLSDAQLLREFAARGNDAAFREIVLRHTDLIYSAALRQVNSPDSAADIAQSVFTDLARKADEVAEKFSADASLAGWLFRSTRFAALNHLRDTHRRRAHERQAMEQLLTNSESAADWTQIAPLLDEAMDTLNDDDRDALLLRFFKNKNLREVGEQLKISDDAAQKRVSRAVEKLREFFTKRKITMGASGLTILISANAVQAAPIGLVAKFFATALAGKTISTSTVIAATKTIAMTTLQKTLVVAALTAAIGTGIYQAHQVSQLREQVQSLQQAQSPLNEQLAQLQHERDDATNQLAGLRAENVQLKSNSNEDELLKLRGEVTQLKNSKDDSSNDPRKALMKSWLAREDRLKQVVEQNPDKTIPELQLLSEEDWLSAARNANFDSDKNIRRTLANLRHSAEGIFASMTEQALMKYMKANNGQFPTDLTQLQSFYATSIDNTVLQRWQIVPQSTLPNQNMGGDWVITQKEPIDPDLDDRWAIGPNGDGTTNYQPPDISAAMAAINPALKAYAAANNGSQPTDPSQILPYLTTPEQHAAYQILLKNIPTNGVSQ